MKKFKKWLLTGVAGVSTALVGALSAFAEGEATTSPVDTVVTEATSQMSSVFSGALTMITNALPYIFGIVGATVVVFVAIKWIKRINK